MGYTPDERRHVLLSLGFSPEEAEDLEARYQHGIANPPKVFEVSGYLPKNLYHLCACGTEIRTVHAKCGRCRASNGRGLSFCACGRRKWNVNDICNNCKQAKIHRERAHPVREKVLEALASGPKSRTALLAATKSSLAAIRYTLSSLILLGVVKKIRANHMDMFSLK